MKRLNKKGFVLVETLIVTAFVVTLFILVYQNTMPIIGEYEKMVLYDDVESIYASNSYKKMLINNGNFEYIDSYLENNSYLDISDCGNSNYHTNSDYCTKLKQEISVTENDYVLITKYDISSFRDEVNSNEFFDSGKLSNFKSYIATVSNVDSFYDSTNTEHVESAKYRIFLTRTVTNSDDSKVVKYVNLGVFLGGAGGAGNNNTGNNNNNGNNSNPTTPTVKLVDKIFDDNEVITSSPTLTTSSENALDRDGLYISTDTNNDDPTYYFRGNVENNYLYFAGNLWRIVRINEDGTIRIILQNGINRKADYFISYRNDMKNGSVLELYYTESDVAKPTVDAWYEDNIVQKGYSDKVATGNYFCEQAKTASSSNNILGSNSNMVLYTSYIANFKCSPDGNGKGLINTSVGLISYDEVIFAGGHPTSRNDSFYLNGSPTYTTSIAGFYKYDGGFNWIFYLDMFYSGISANLGYRFETFFRPVLNLVADSECYGSGTLNDPYVVN